MTEPKVWVVIPAAGVGARMQADRPKQYLMLHGRTVLEYTLACFTKRPQICAQICGIVLVVALDDAHWADLSLDVPFPLHCVVGGDERAQSVLNALDFLSAMMENNTDAEHDPWVLVHDAARPCLHQDDLTHLIQSLSHDPVGGLLAVPVRDTMKRADAAGRVVCTESRVGLWHALTPQMFRLHALRTCLQRALVDEVQVTDEASAMEHAGFAPRLVEGRADNIKITRPEDLALAEFFLHQRELTL
jgi:2-C-methyl-D-erythritol 4-phosphate cytidylyltransferase